MRLRSGKSSQSEEYTAVKSKSVDWRTGVTTLTKMFTRFTSKTEGVSACKGDHGCDPKNRASLKQRCEDSNQGPSQHEYETPNSSRPMDLFKPHGKYVLWGLQASAVALVILYFILPSFIRLFPSFMAEIAFLHRVRWPPFVNLSNPSELTLNYTRAFKLPTTGDVVIGAWHTLPLELQKPGLTDEDYTPLLSQGAPIILYLHGNAGTRAGWHRVQLYKLLSKAGFHVIAFDYRGYADSNGSPSEDGLCEDGLSVYEWLSQNRGKSPLYIWGHSMGSGVATKVSKQICDAGLPMDGLVLEAPFNNFLDAASYHPFSQPFKFLPWFTWGFIEALHHNKISFSSDTSILKVTVPTLILHAEDDGIVPYKLGRKLYQAALVNKAKGGVQMVTFEGHHGYGHKHIHKAPQLPQIIKSFTEGKSVD